MMENKVTRNADVTKRQNCYLHELTERVIRNNLFVYHERSVLERVSRPIQEPCGTAK